MTNFAQQFQITVHEIELPSGIRVKTTRPDALTVISESDDIPDTFFNILVDAAQGKNPAAQSGSDMAQFLRMLNPLVVQIAVRHWVSPTVVVAGEPDMEQDEIGVEHVKALSMQDKQFLTNWAMHGGDPVDLLRRFRQQSEAHASGSPDR